MLIVILIMRVVVVVVVVNSLRPEASSLKGIYTLFALSIAYIVVIVSISKGKAVPAAKTSLAYTLFLERFLFVVVLYSSKSINPYVMSWTVPFCRCSIFSQSNNPSLCDTGPLTRPFSM